MSDSENEEIASPLSCDSLDFLDEDDSDGENRLDPYSGESLAPASNSKRGGCLKKLPLACCHICKKRHYSLESYSNHLKLHLVEDLLTFGPSRADLLQCCRDHAISVLEEIQSSKLCHGIAGEVKRISDCLLSQTDEVRNIFVECVAEFLLPCFPTPSMTTIPHFHSIFLKEVNTVLNDLSVRNVIVTVLKEIFGDTFTEVTLNFFKTKFFNALAQSVECSYLKYMREPHELLVYGVNPGCEVNSDNRDNLDDVNFQQTIHYIGGSCVRSVLSLGYMYNKSDKWKRIVNVVKKNMLVGSLVNAPSENIEAWARARDRGGLKFISEPIWSLLMALSGILKNAEESDGSISHDTVLCSLLNDEILMQIWKSIINDELNDEESRYLLGTFCHKYVNAWGNGVAVRRKNVMLNATKGKVALRAQISR